MRVSIGLFWDGGKDAEVGRISVRFYTRSNGGKKRGGRVGNVPNLQVQRKHWNDGNLTGKAPVEQRELVNELLARIVKFQAELLAKPRYVSASSIKAFLWPDITDGWVKLFKAAADQPVENTAVHYHYALKSFERFAQGKQPTAEVFEAWALAIRTNYEPKTVNSYIGSVRSCFEAIGIVMKRRGLRVKEPKIKGGIALSLAELLAIYNLDLKPGSSLARHRDALLCACITSLRCCDWYHFRLENVGLDVINTKTGARTPIPMHPVLIELIERNGGYIKTADNPNRALRRIGKLASATCPSLNTLVTFRKKEIPRWLALVSHVGRRTYVSHGFSHRVDPADLLRFTGHSSFKQLEHYNAGSLTVEERTSQDAVIATKVIPLDTFTSPKLSVVNEG